jgi:hypothetical protein
MALEGLAQVRARIAELQGTTGARTGTSAAAGDPGFASVLASAIGDDPSSADSSALSLSALGLSPSDGSASGSDLTLGGLLANPAIALSASALGLTGAGSTSPSALSALSSVLGTGAATTAGSPVPATSAAGATAAAPPELAAFGNGRIPEALLVPIDGDGNRLWAPAARAFDAMRAAAAGDGVDLGVTSSYRSYDQQVQMAEQEGRYGQGGLAAEPGHSEHGWGRALDLDVGADGQAWLRQHAGAYGFAAPVDGEPWHWEYGTGR